MGRWWVMCCICLLYDGCSVGGVLGLQFKVEECSIAVFRRSN